MHLVAFSNPFWPYVWSAYGIVIFVLVMIVIIDTIEFYEASS